MRSNNFSSTSAFFPQSWISDNRNQRFEANSAPFPQQFVSHLLVAVGTSCMTSEPLVNAMGMKVVPTSSHHQRFRVQTYWTDLLRFVLPFSRVPRWNWGHHDRTVGQFITLLLICSIFWNTRLINLQSLISFSQDPV